LSPNTSSSMPSSSSFSGVASTIASSTVSPMTNPTKTLPKSQLCGGFVIHNPHQQPDNMETVECRGMIGRYVVVVPHQTPIVMCEFEVYSSKCHTCQPGKFQTAMNHTTCLSCPAGQWSVAPFSSPAGKFLQKRLSGGHFFEQCPGGTFQPKLAQTGEKSCLDCAAGHISPQGAPNCAACAAGKYQEGTRKGGLAGGKQVLQVTCLRLCPHGWPAAYKTHSGHTDRRQLWQDQTSIVVGSNGLSKHLVFVAALPPLLVSVRIRGGVL